MPESTPTTPSAAPDAPRPSSAKILHVDDDAPLAKAVARVLRMNGYQNLEHCASAAEARAALKRSLPDVMLLDLVLPSMRGEALLREIARDHPGLPVIVLTAEYDPRAAIECLRCGARDFLQKPVRTEELLAAIARAIEISALQYEADALRRQFFSTQLRQPEAFSEIVTRDAKMLRVFAYLEAVARGSQPVLIRGETGTGKELAARALHKVSGRRGPFVAVNVAGLDDELFADTLFGHVRGAFTGAERDRVGLMERARGGTLLLDEVGDLSATSQVKLLRVLQEREFLPVGSDEARPLDARIVAATHHEAEKRLREDLYFRLRAYQLELPPLRERLGDLPLLVDLFLQAAADDLGRPKPAVPDELYLDLAQARFPGNIRELRAIVFDAVARHGQGVMPIELFTDALTRDPDREAAPPDADAYRFPQPMPLLKQVEHAAVLEALERVGGNRSAAARMLGVSRPTILRHVEGPVSGDGADDESVRDRHDR